MILGTSGNLIPGVQARLVSLSNGTDISAFDTSGELFVQSPSVTNLGYLDNPKASAETFVVDPSNGDDCWLRTGDEAMFVRGAGGPHLVIVDRIKELIKVKVRLDQLTCGMLIIINWGFLLAGPSSTPRRARSVSPHTC